MAKYKFLSETPTEEEGKHQYSLEVTLEATNAEPVHVQDVIFDADKCQEQAQEYADALEKELQDRAEAEAKEAEATEE